MSDVKTDVLYYGDNLEILRKYVPDASVDLVYLDPPFNSNRDYNVIFKDESGRKSDAQLLAFEDTWHWGPDAEAQYAYLTNTARNEGRVPSTVSTIVAALRSGIGENQMMAYLVEMAVRLVELHRILTPTGSLYLHCDPTASHYLKVLLDAIFDARNFRNEIVWKRSSAHSDSKQGARHYGRVSDTLLFYAKSDENVFNQQYGPYDEDYLAENYKRRDPDGRVYRIDNIQGPGGESKGNPQYEFLGVTRYCGCGTALVAAQKLGRRWIGIDITYLSIAVMKARLKDSFGLADVEVIGQPTEVEGARALLKGSGLEGQYQFQWWALDLVGAQPQGGTQKKGADKGIDGVISFSTGPRGEVGRALVSVKSGTVNSGMIRDLKGVLEREKAEIGLFVTLDEPSAPMRLEAATAGVYHSELSGRDYQKIQILTIAELLEEHRRPDLPLLVLPTYQRAERVEKKAAEQRALFGE
jgi:site-specific DNA-methyltransferase (adenine-specific)